MKKLDVIFVATAVACGFLAVVMLRLAWAGVPDDPGETVGLLTELWRKGQILQMAIVGVFATLTFASRKIPWVTAGHRGVYVSAALGGFAILAEAASRGTTPSTSMLMTAALTTMALVMNSQAPAQVSAGQSFSQAVVTRPPRPPVEVIKQDDNSHPSASDK